MTTRDTEQPPAILALSDGSVFRGEALGAVRETSGLVVFNTSMTGYEEMLTDPSYGGQILVPTYPLIGNYGINLKDAESKQIQVQAFVVRNHCDTPSHPYEQMTVHEYLLKNDIPGLAGVDTRAITRRIRSGGVMMGVVMPGEDADAAMQALKRTRWYGDQNWVDKVATTQEYQWQGDAANSTRATAELKIRAARYRHSLIDTTQNQDRPSDEPTPDSTQQPLRIAVIDFGVKHNILRSLRARGCRVDVFPAYVTADEIAQYRPDGVVLSPGPGDPALLDTPVQTIRRIADIDGDGSDAIPMLAICIGHQLVARALGADTFMLHFGHRGGNQPVLDTRNGRVYVTAHNHGYAVDPQTLPQRDSLKITHINLNDNTVEGIADKDRNIMTIQFHSEASPGPHDSEKIFDEFIASVLLSKQKQNTT